ncbi:MAG: hypothetical protein HFG50_15965 [Lachnospiraceae bacterium]|nr:hypothetical protein [Lachnospiraceae bacterium]
MSMKKLKQQVAAALIVAMTATNVLSAFAADGVGQPNKKREVAVTFNSGAGYFETASKSSVATFSNAKKTDLTQDESKIATQSSITRTFMMDGKEFDDYVAGIEGGAFKNDTNEYYVNLENADHWFAELAVDENLRPEMLKLEENAGLEFAGWYDNSEKIPKAVDKSTEIYNGAVLDAGWKTPQTLPDTVDKAFDELVAVGLPQDAKLVLGEVKDTDKKEHADLAKELIEINDKAAVGGDVYELVEGTPIVSVDINVENLESNAKGIVTVLLPTPEGLKDVKLDAGERIIAIHYAKNDTYIIPVEVDPETENMSFELDLSQGFSPFFFVKAKVAEKPEPDNPNPPTPSKVKVTVKVIGSNDGYIAAWTRDELGVTYLPVNEDVTLDKGTQLYYVGVAHGDKECTSYTITNTETSEKSVINGWEAWPFTVENNCEIAPTFEAYESGDDDYSDENYCYAWLEPGLLTAEGAYSGVVHVEEWDAEAKDFKAVTGAKLRIPTEEDIEKYKEFFYRFGIDEIAWELFDYVAEGNEVRSKNALKPGTYHLPMILTYENEEHLMHNLQVRVGVWMNFIPGLYSYDGKIVVENELEWRLERYDERRFNYANGDNWSKIEELLKAEPINPVPRMYNYEFAGWQTVDGVEYASNTRLVPENREDYEFYAVAIFTDKDGKTYFGNKTSGNQDNNNGGGSNSSGGGSRRHVIGGSSSTITSMTGTWTMGENGWKFLKTNGEYATNTWGYINNQWYYFNEAGDMVTGWYFVNGRWYYLNPAEGSFQGAMLTGVIFDPFYNAYFYADANGAMVTGWYQVADKWYYFNPVSDGRQGALLADTVIDGYYVGADGAWVSGN